LPGRTAEFTLADGSKMRVSIGKLSLERIKMNQQIMGGVGTDTGYENWVIAH
jgi:hypothetical protein